MMRATVQAKHLTAAMHHSVAARMGTMPILQHALIEAPSSETVRITTTDLETVVAVTLPATVEEDGSVCALSTLLRAAAGIGPELLLVEQAGALRVTAGARRGVTVPTLSAAEFPTPDSEEWKPLALDPVALRSALDRVAYAAGVCDVRYYLNTVHLREGWAESSDGHRAARARLRYSGPDLLIPASRAAMLAGLLDADSRLDVCGTRMLRVSGVSGAVVLSLLLVAARYPDMDTIFPQRAGDSSFTVPRANLLASLVALAPFAKTDATGALTKFPAIAIHSDGAAVSLQLNRDGGSIDVDACTEFDGEFTLGANPDYVRDAFVAIEGEREAPINVSRHGGANSGARLLLQAPDGDSQHLVMELRL
jgi:DNA polymerase III sliding clamp (beta) subunit (PCNA family)